MLKTLPAIAQLSSENIEGYQRYLDAIRQGKTLTCKKHGQVSIPIEDLEELLHAIEDEGCAITIHEQEDPIKKFMEGQQERIINTTSSLVTDILLPGRESHTDRTESKRKMAVMINIICEDCLVEYSKQHAQNIRYFVGDHRQLIEDCVFKINMVTAGTAQPGAVKHEVMSNIIAALCGQLLENYGKTRR